MILLSCYYKVFYLPVQVNPSPVYPGRQLQVMLLSVLVQTAAL